MSTARWSPTTRCSPRRRGEPWRAAGGRNPVRDHQQPTACRPADGCGRAGHRHADRGLQRRDDREGRRSFGAPGTASAPSRGRRLRRRAFWRSAASTPGSSRPITGCCVGPPGRMSTTRSSRLASGRPWSRISARTWVASARSSASAKISTSSSVARASCGRRSATARRLCARNPTTSTSRTRSPTKARRC